MKMRYFISAIFGYKVDAKFAIRGTKNIHRARTAIPARKRNTFKKVVEPRLIFILSTSVM